MLFRSWRAEGKKIGFTNGVFDLLHPGHISLLSQAKAACDKLVVAINSDASVARLKGPTRPVQGEAARAAVLKEEMEEALATLEFDGAVHKLLADPLQRELETLLAAIQAGTADEDDKARYRWLMLEVQRRRQMGWRPVTAEDD